MNALRGRVSNYLDELVYQTDHCTRHFVPPSTKIPYATNRGLRRVEWSFGPLGVIQNPHAPARRGGWDHVSSLSRYTKGPRESSAGWCQTPSVPSRSWAPSLPHTLSGGTGIGSPLHAWWTLSTGRTRRWGPTSPVLTKRLSHRWGGRQDTRGCLHE